MTVASAQNQAVFEGDGSNTAFTFSFIGVAAADLSVVYTAVGGAETLLDPSVYTLSLNAAAAGALWGIGGTLTYPKTGSPIASGTTLTLTRVLPYTQDTSVASQGPTFQSIEAGMDRLEMQIQQIASGSVLPEMTSDLPSTDPGITGSLWWNSNVLTRSAG